MRKLTAPLAGVIALSLAAGLGAQPAMAQDNDDRFQVKVLATAVLPDGNITSVTTDLVGLPAGTQTEANNNVIPTVAIEYFLADNISIETICCVTQHDVDISAGALIGAEAVSDARVIPATFTLKYHLNPGGISPYIGAGPAYFLWIDSESGADTTTLGAPGQHMTDEFGFALQAGIDVPINDGLFLSVDAKKYWVGTTSTWFDATGATVIQTEHDIDPWVVSVGVGFSF